MDTKPITFVQALFEVARGNKKVSHYEKFKQVDARPAVEGEVIVTIVNGVEETKSTASQGDYVVRAKSKSKEMYVVKGDVFQKRYKKVEGCDADEDGFVAYNPIGECYAFQYEGEGFSFIAPWGEDMVVNDGDYIAAIDIDNLDDIYRIEKEQFGNTYREIENE